MKIANDITETIGNTPLVKLKNSIEGKGVLAEIVAKLEYFNPGSSVKDRVALSLIEDAEKKGILNKESVIVEATSGNTGIGISMVAAAKGYKVMILMPETMSAERRQLMRAFGAELVLTEGAKGMPGAIAKASELVASDPKKYVMLGQFDNPQNPQAHKKGTALEIINDTDGKVDYFVAGVGTGGTLTGVGEVLKEKIPGVKIIAVEPATSAVLSGEPKGPHGIQGIGAGFIPSIMNMDVVDEIVKVKDEDALSTSRELAAKDGIFVGISAGAAAWAAIQIAKRKESEGKRVVVLLADTGERYLSTPLFKDFAG